MIPQAGAVNLLTLEFCLIHYNLKYLESLGSLSCWCSNLLELIDDSDLSNEERLAKLTFYHKVCQSRSMSTKCCVSL